MTSISKTFFIDKLADTVNKYSNTYHNTIKRDAVDVKSQVYSNFSKENSKKYPKFKGSDDLRIKKYKNIFAKGGFQIVSVPIWSGFVWLKVKNNVPPIYIINDLNGK